MAMTGNDPFFERSRELVARDGARWLLTVLSPAQPRAALLWIPALGVAARSYRRFAEALAVQGVAVALHEWRGIDSRARKSTRRPPVPNAHLVSRLLLYKQKTHTT